MRIDNSNSIDNTIGNILIYKNNFTNANNKSNAISLYSGLSEIFSDHISIFQNNIINIEGLYSVYILSDGSNNGSASMNMQDNWWGTIDENVINEMVYDYNDNFNLPLITYRPFLTEEILDAGSSLPFIIPQPPTANAGPDQVVFDTVTLDGSASYDPDVSGSIASYDWLLEYIDDATYNQTVIGVNPTIIDLHPGFYNAHLTVTDNEGSISTDTSLIAAAGSCSCKASTMYVESIITSTVRGSKGNSYGEVIVTVADDCGSPVIDAKVTGTFSGDFNETRSGVTESNGVAVIRTISEFKKPSYTFCVDNVVKGSLVYDNIESCNSN